MKINFKYIFLLVLILLFKFPTITSASTKVNTFQVTFSSQKEDWPAIYKDNIYWVDPRGGIYGYNTKTKTESPFLSQSTLPNLYALIDFDGQYILYNSYDNISYNVNAYDTLAHIVINVTTGIGTKWASGFDGNKIVYIDGYGSGDLYVYDLNSKDKLLIAHNASVPKISGRYVVWYFGTGGGYDIRAYDLINKLFVDIPNPNGGSRQSPNIYKDKIVYAYQKGNLNSIRLFDLNKKEEKILIETSSYSMSWPSISDKYAVWGKDTSPNVSGIEGIDLNSGEIFTIQDQGPQQNGNMLPIIKGNVAAWMAWRTGNGDIYGSILDSSNKPFLSLPSKPPKPPKLNVTIPFPPKVPTFPL